jgi:ubiquinone/menaquinone biosynthesis C-methylase UbiE
VVRALVVVMILVAAACGRHDAGPPSAGSGSDDDGAQARFDAERRPEKLVEALGLHPGSRVADIGAGSGLITVHLARAVAPTGKVVATDVDGGVLDLLARRMDRLGLGGVVERRVVSATEPGLEPGAYDAILLAEVDNFFADPVAWLRAAQTALKPGGRIVISNRIYHRTQSLAAAKKAGLVLQSETTPVPTHFIAVFVSGDTQ